MRCEAAQDASTNEDGESQELLVSMRLAVSGLGPQIR